MEKVCNLDMLLQKAKEMPTRTVAIAAADDPDVLKSAANATSLGLAKFNLIGPQEKLNALLTTLRLDILTEDIIIDAGTQQEAAEKAVSLVRQGKADTLMKGQLQTGTFLRAVLDKEKGLRTGNLLGQCGIYDTEGQSGLLFITDCAMNIAPDLDQKRQLIENAVSLAHKLGYLVPKVAVLTALETVNIDMPETIEAAVLSKMADRGQIKGCLVDGPFALDNAVSLEAARHKCVSGPVAGQADILLVPDLKTGNVLHKSLVYFAKRKNAALLLGAAVPIIMTSRTDPVETKVLSIALGCYVS